MLPTALIVLAVVFIALAVFHVVPVLWAVLLAVACVVLFLLLDRRRIGF